MEKHWISAVVVIVGFTFTSYSLEAKTHCQQAKAKHQAIQYKLRQGGKGQSVEKLRARERSAWQKWWQCQQSGAKPASKKATKKRKSAANNHQQRKVSKSKRAAKSQITPPPVFHRNQSLKLRGAFSGAKQQAWLDHYQKPKKCIQPTSMQVFAYCIEHAREQQAIFSQQYDENH
ncbi:hypothetical protein LP316_04790 [Thalassotalea sp. LPB0316]|uniref:hypothetical protein n=1 Tax=Thalassotalea sp. LPB0316 TaxID=2769490 RepID=UPI00186630F7|nr:hypothetical protein [Thalassotalea sp. LPB0316]QOL26622.1 hypothetical protein LP316_04790 [Thalassotalea sp. LPB0316]